MEFLGTGDLLWADMQAWQNLEMTAREFAQKMLRAAQLFFFSLLIGCVSFWQLRAVSWFAQLILAVCVVSCIVGIILALYHTLQRETFFSNAVPWEKSTISPEVFWKHRRLLVKKLEYASFIHFLAIGTKTKGSVDIKMLRRYLERALIKVEASQLM